MTLGWEQTRNLILGIAAIACYLAVPILHAAEDARVLPVGRSRLGVTYGRSGNVSQTYNNSGSAESLTAAYQFDLNSQALSSFDSRMGALVSALNGTGYRYDSSQRHSATHGVTHDQSKPLLGEALTRGHLGTDAVAKRQQYQISIQHGITDNLSIGFGIPYLRTQVNVTHSLTGMNTAADIRAALGTRGLNTALDAYLAFISSADSETFQQVLKERGYSRFEDHVTNGMGDMVLGGRYNYMSSRRFIHSVQFGTTVPTGKLSLPREITEVHNGQGAWDIGFAHLFNYLPTSRLMLSQGLHYTHAIPASRIKRVRENPSDVFPATISDERIEMRLGEKAWITAGALFKVSDAFSLDCGYEWFWKTQDRYSGNRNKDYTYLSELTDKYAETVQVGMTISSIPSFLKKEFPLPGEVTVNYYWPTRGRNALIAPYGTAELALYF